MPYFIYAWTAAFLLGLWSIIAKLTVKHQLKNAWQFAFFSLLFESGYIAVIAWWRGAGIPVHWFDIVLAAGLMAIGTALYMLAIKYLDVSVMTPLFNIRVVMTVVLGYLFLGEVLTVKSIWLIGVVVVAGFFAAVDERFSPRSFLSKYIGWGLLFMLTLAIRSILINRAIDQNGYWTTNLWMALLSIVIAGMAFYPKYKDDLKKTKLRDYSGAMLMAVVGSLGELAVNKSYEGNVGIASVIISLPISMVLALLFAIFKPDLLEKHTLKVYAIRFGAAGVMIWGALQLSS